MQTRKLTYSETGLRLVGCTVVFRFVVSPQSFPNFRKEEFQVPTSRTHIYIVLLAMEKRRQEYFCQKSAFCIETFSAEISKSSFAMRTLDCEMLLKLLKKTQFLCVGVCSRTFPTGVKLILDLFAALACPHKRLPYESQRIVVCDLTGLQLKNALYLLRFSNS